MTPELIARIDAWLDSHEAWWRSTDDRLALACEWSQTSAMEIMDAGRVAAMRGILLALVREAWGDRSIYVRQVVRRGAIIWAAISSGDDLMGIGDTEGDALVAALEAAPEAQP